MAEQSQTSPPSPNTHRTCPDCGAEFDTTAQRGVVAGCCEACQIKRLASVEGATTLSLPMVVKTPWYRSRIFLFCLLFTVAAGTCGVVWWRELFAQYHHWTQNMHARRAERSFAAGDYEHAIIDARRALDFDPLDVEANRVIAKSREAQGSFEAIPWRARLNLIRPGDPENAIAWAQDALKAGLVETAEDALAVLKPEDRKGAAFHDISATIAMLRADIAKAESHWSEAVRLDPASEDYRLRLAKLQLRSRTPAVREAAGKTLEALAQIPRHRLNALRALIEDAMQHEEYPRARALADRMIASPDATFTERLGRLAVLRSQESPDAPSYLEQLRDESLRDPEQLSVLLNWMNQNDLPVLVSDWVPGLPPALVAQPPVCLAVADAYGRDRDWPKLRAFVEKAVWKDFEYVRLAHLAHALENFGNVVAAEKTWGLALKDCGEKPERLAALVRLAQSWRWDGRAELTLRKLSADDRTPLWVLDALWSISKKSGDTAELHRLSRLMVKARPKNVPARNNFIRMTLLRRVDEGATDQLAADLFAERPTDIACATTYALSLFFQHKVFDAQRVMQAFPPEQLREPEPALYYGIFLQASGDTAKAEEFLRLAKGNTLLREEEDLISQAKRDSRENTLTPIRKPPPSQ